MKLVNLYACTALLVWLWTTATAAQPIKPLKTRQQPTGDFVVVEEWNQSDRTTRTYLLLADPKMAPPVKGKRLTPDGQPPAERELFQPVNQLNGEAAGPYTVFPGQMMGRLVNRPPWLGPTSSPTKKEQDQ